MGPGHVMGLPSTSRRSQTVCGMGGTFSSSPSLPGPVVRIHPNAEGPAVEKQQAGILNNLCPEFLWSPEAAFPFFKKAPR